MIQEERVFISIFPEALFKIKFSYGGYGVTLVGGYHRIKGGTGWRNLFILNHKTRLPILKGS